MKEGTKIVYCYNYRNLIYVTRDSEGEWYFHYTPSKIYSTIHNSYVISQRNRDDVFKKIGYKMHQLLLRCKKSYGDPIEEPKTKV